MMKKIIRQKDTASKYENLIYNRLVNQSKKEKNIIVKRHITLPLYSKNKKIKEQKNVDITVQYNGIRTFIEYDGITHRKRNKRNKDRRFDNYVKKNNFRLIRINARRFRRNKTEKIKELLNLIKDTTQRGVKRI